MGRISYGVNVVWEGMWFGDGMEYVIKGDGMWH
jgi:hypothetical protein